MEVRLLRQRYPRPAHGSMSNGFLVAPRSLCRHTGRELDNRERHQHVSVRSMALWPNIGPFRSPGLAREALLC